LGLDYLQQQELQTQLLHQLSSLFLKIEKSIVISLTSSFPVNSLKTNEELFISKSLHIRSSTSHLYSRLHVVRTCVFFRMAIVLSLKSKSHGKGEERFLVVSRKIKFQDLIREVIAAGGETPKYKAVPPTPGSEYLSKL
jgi:hypothetical protein